VGARAASAKTIAETVRTPTRTQITAHEAMSSTARRTTASKRLSGTDASRLEGQTRFQKGR
jgi:hypothetical protein